jgi:hypothetical protein
MRRLQGGAHLDLAIGLPLRNREALTNLLQQIADPSSPNFRHYLSADEFAASFGPSPEDYQAVINFAMAHGLTIKRTHANRTLLDVTGSVADIEKALHVHMQVYQHPTEARTFFAPDKEPSLDLATPVLAISGLDSYVKPHPHIHPMIRPLGGGSGGGGGGGSGGSGADGSYLGSDFRDAYAPGVSLKGTGQSVGLFELTGYSHDDISDYEDEANLPDVFLNDVFIDGFEGDDSNPEYAVEATADVEMAISMAPGLDSVLVYEGPTPLYDAPLGTNAIQFSYTTAQINDVLNRMATDNLAHQLSCSYQMDINLSTVQIFQQFAAQGQSFFQASGDFGAFPGAIDEPSDDPYITVVGGTTLNTGSSGSWASETAWLTPAMIDPILGNTPLEATGGGVSLVYGIPSWQQGVSMTANQGSTTMRNLPDVALVANNVDIVYGNTIIGESFDFTEAGTSLAAPLWAAFTAMVNQQAAINGQPPVGFVNPALYAIGKSAGYHSCFHDVTTGNNFTPSSPSKYSAVAGYDLCTGWGTLIGSNMIQALLAPPSHNLVITPPFGFTSTGPGGGPYTVTSQTYTLNNIGSKPLIWTAANTSSWLNISSAAGTLNPGGAKTVTVSLNSTANNFLISSQSGNVSFADLTDGTTENRQFDLAAGNGGFESGDLTNWTLVIGDTNLVFALASDDVDVAGTNALGGEADVLFVHSGMWGGYLGEWDNYGQSPPEGTLSQSVTTTAGQRYVVSFWLTCVPYQGTNIPNNFTAKWNGAALYSKSNLPAFDWTNLQFVVPATTGRTTLEYDFNDVPGAFGLDDVTVEPVPPPVFQTVARTPGNIAFTWSGFSNLSYQIQAATNLITPNWTNVGTPITATNNVVGASESVGTAARQFYRAILLP